MTSTITSFLKTEITIIPSLLRKCFGRSYNNTLCNGITWMFVLFYLLHITFDHSLDMLLKKMKFKEYIRIRLKNSLWHLGFFSTFFFYIQATLYTQGLRLIDFKSLHKQSISPDQIQLGFILVATFYLHSAFWEQLRHYNFLGTLEFISVLVNIGYLYGHRFSDGFFRFTSLICIVNITLEITRLFVIQAELSKQNTTKSKIILRIIFSAHLFVFFACYIVAVPYMMTYSFNLMHQKNSMQLTSLLIFWFIAESVVSALFRSIAHLLSHRSGVTICYGLLDCALFNMRWDAAHTLLILRQDIKDREEKVMSLRKPKNKNIVVQTLKCMVALKRKLNAKRESLSSNQEEFDLAPTLNSTQLNNKTTEILDTESETTEENDEVSSETEEQVEQSN